METLILFKFAREKNGSPHFKKHHDVTIAMIKEAFINFTQEGPDDKGNFYRIGKARFGEKLKIIFRWVEPNRKVLIITAFEV